VRCPFVFKEGIFRPFQIFVTNELVRARFTVYVLLIFQELALPTLVEISCCQNNRNISYADLFYDKNE
jgi:hypothetical protein